MRIDKTIGRYEISFGIEMHMEENDILGTTQLFHMDFNIFKK